MEQEMEMQLWEYMDGVCCKSDAERIAMLITEDATWGEKFAELTALNAAIGSSLELEQPSVRFTKNVMETVAALNMAPAAKKYINPFVIKGIAALFVVMILAILAFAFAAANYSSKSGSWLSLLKLSQPDLTGLFNSFYIKIFVMINIVLGLALADGIIKRKLRTNLESI